MERTMRYQIYGDYGYINETLLYETDRLSEAQHWFDGYTADETLGGYDIVELSRFSTVDGEFISIQRTEAAEEFLFDEF